MSNNEDLFADNYARAASYFVSTCAPAPETPERIAAYRLITGIYRRLLENAGELGIKTFPDAPFAPWEKQKGREKDVANIRGPIEKIESWILSLYTLVICGTPKDDRLELADSASSPKGVLKKLLTECGCSCEKQFISMPYGCAFGLRELAEISRNNTIPITDAPKPNKEHLFFSRCAFDPSSEWTAFAFDRLLNANGHIVKLCRELEKRGYTRIDCRDGKKISLDYVKQHGSKPEPIKTAWAERSHSGIELSYEEIVATPAYLWVRMPFFKTVLDSENKLPKRVVEFISAYTKNCDGCHYCVQTDKTGERPLAAMQFDKAMKCPLYPGFSMNFRQVNEQLIADILDVIDALNTLEL